MRVDIRPNRKKGFYTVVPHGSIDTESHDYFRSVVGPLLNKSTKGICVDLKKTDYISSAGLGVLFLIKKFMKENGGDLLFCNPKPQIRKLFETVKVLPKESIFKSLEEADFFFYSIMDQEIERRKNDPDAGSKASAG